jgi:hypothetical protein
MKKYVEVETQLHAFITSVVEGGETALLLVKEQPVPTGFEVGWASEWVWTQ